MNETEKLVANLINPAIKKANVAAAPYLKAAEGAIAHAAQAMEDYELAWNKAYAAEIRENEDDY
jgi:hypothetical protein